MKLLNSDFWSTWKLAITASGDVVGDSQMDGVKGPERGDSHFEVKLDGKRFKGRGSRSYPLTRQGKVQRCRVSYDALLARIDS